VAAGGPASAKIAAELGDALFATEPKLDIVERYRRAGGDGPRYGEVPLAWASDETQAVQTALTTSRWAVTGWKVMTELPNPANFDAGTRWVDEDDIRRQFAVGPDAGAHVQAVQAYVDAGFDRLALLNVGPDPDGFIDFFERDLASRVRSLTPGRA
jgi:G6PDH family F420-dependent oxidoreductase